MTRTGRRCRLPRWIGFVLAAGPATLAAAEWTTLVPTQDAYVRGGTHADSNYGNTTTLRVKNASNANFDRRSLLQFDLSGISGSIQAATLRLFCSALSNGAPAAVFVHALDDDDWQESTLTWNTAPVPSALLDSTASVTAAGTSYAFDVTAFVAAQHAGDAVASFLLRDDLQVNKMIDFDAREGAQPPALDLEVQNVFTLSVATQGSGQVTLIPGAGAYNAGTRVTLTAQADDGWQFDSWSGDLVGSANPDSVTMDADRSVVATFQPQYALSLGVLGLGTIDLDPPGGFYDAGTDVTLTAIPASGWNFSGWTGDTASTANPLVVTMSADQNIGAWFTSGPLAAGEIVFQEDESGGTGGSMYVTTESDLIGADGELYLAAVSSQPFQPTSTVSGLGLTWTLVDEQCSARGTTGVSVWMAQGIAGPPGPVTAVLADFADALAIVVARYSGVDPATPVTPQASRNTLGSEGACSGGSDTTAYAFALPASTPGGAVVAAVAHGDALHSPASGWDEHEQFHSRAAVPGASLSLVERDASAPDTLALAGSFDVASDWAVGAVELRAAPQDVLALSTAGLGTVALSPAGGTYAVDTVVSLSATPEPGWSFVRWDDGLSGHANPASVLMRGSVSIDAVFSSVVHYDLGVVIDGVGCVTLDPPGGRYASGTAVSASVEIPPGWIFTGWSGDANGKSPSTIVSVDADRTLTASFRHVGASANGLWSSAGELAASPMSGGAWDALLAAADQNFFPPDPADPTSDGNVHCLAAALVYARTGDASYRDRVVQALDHLPTLGNPGNNTLAWARELGAFALAADLVGYSSGVFDLWLRDMAETYLASDGRTVLQMFRDRPNNWGTHAFGMLVCVYAFLRDDAMLSTLRSEWIDLVSGRSTQARFGELWWQHDPAAPRTINPTGARRQGIDLDGAIPDDVRRGGPFEIPPNVTNYPWEALQGLVLAARVLERYDPEMSIWYVEDKALLRAARLLQESWETQFGGWAASGDDMWMLPFFDAVYGTSWSTGHPDEFQHGKNTGWAYVLPPSAGPPTSTTRTETGVFRVYRNVPNPFASRTRIRFHLPRARNVRVAVYDVLGRRVASLLDGPCPAGLHTLDWAGEDVAGQPVASGVYWCRIDAGEQRERVRLVLVR